MKIVPSFIQKSADKSISSLGGIVPKGVKNWVSSPRTAEFVENTFFAVSIETTLKMMGRPTFIMLDKEADSEEKKKYAAVKEMLYQGLCLGLYLGALPHIKNALYKVISKGLSKKDANAAKEIEAFNKEKHIVADAKQEYKKTGSLGKRLLNTLGIKKDATIKAAKEQLQKAERTLHKNIHDKQNLKLGKGVYELSAIIGSILMLTVAAPQISHFIIHPIMNALNMEKHEEKKEKVA